MIGYLATQSSCYEHYRGRRAVLATRHRKEKAVSPAFLSTLGLELSVPDGLDTDSLGTFTRDVARHASMRETALLKARLGMEASGLPLAIASEGSFGPHPLIPFLPAGRELLLFVDAEQGLEICEEAMSERTNFAALEVTQGADVDGFLASVGFPDHALVVRSGEKLVKGVASRTELDRLLDAGGPLQLETDMRAHLNPTRMGEISRLAERLARRIATACPACGTAGFGPVRCERGLPCADCDAPTQLVRLVVEACTRCLHEQRKPRPDGRLTANPAQCPECNP